MTTTTEINGNLALAAMPEGEQLGAAQPKTKRLPGSGELEMLSSGRVRARLPRSLGRKPIGTFDTEEEAERILNATLVNIASGSIQLSSGAVTLDDFAQKVYFPHRRETGKRGWKVERDRWIRHFAESWNDKPAFGTRPLEKLGQLDIRALRDELQQRVVVRRFRRRSTGELVTSTTPGKQLEKQALKNLLNLLRSVLEHAVEKGLIAENPAMGIKPTKVWHRTRETWTTLNVDEQRAFATRDAIPEWVRVMAQFAWGTGLRKSELACLELADFHPTGERPHVVVRFGAPGLPPKNGKPRTVPLFGAGLEAAKRWLEILPTFAEKNPKGLVFPTVRGMSRFGRRLKRWEVFVRAAGIPRRVRWHDLRHTCATALVNGWWGRKWSLDEACLMLGHSSVKVTEKYAHTDQDTLDRAARETGGGSSGGGGVVRRGREPVAPRVPHTDSKSSARPGRFERPTTGSVDPGHPSSSEALELSAGQRGAIGDLLGAVMAGDAVLANVRARLLAGLVAAEHPAGRLVAAALGQTDDLVRAALDYAEGVAGGADDELPEARQA